MLPGNKHNILLEFETVVDIDYGVLQLVEEKYEQDDRFYHQLMYLGDKQIKGLIHNNDSNNPVRILMDIEDYDEADRIYSDIMENEIYPLVIIRDRYTGVYSGGKYTAWSGDVEDILPPPEVNDDDIVCMNFWYEQERTRHIS